MDTKRCYAYHEAAHAVVRWYLGGKIKKISIIPDTRGSMGHVIPDDNLLSSLHIQTLVAGDVAVELFCDEIFMGIECEFQSDDDQLYQVILFEMNVALDQIEAVKQHAREQVKKILLEPKVRAGLDALVEELMAKRKMDGVTAKRIFTKFAK